MQRRDIKHLRTGAGTGGRRVAAVRREDPDGAGVGQGRATCRVEAGLLWLKMGDLPPEIPSRYRKLASRATVDTVILADAMSGLPERLTQALGDRYAVEREVGRGGMAVVYLAKDLRHHRPVALKVLRPELGKTLGAERFLREIRIAARLNHPRIVPLLDSGEADGLLFYVMAYVEGETLRERLDREKQLPVDEAVRITRQVAAALAFAHEQGVVHRDVKPGNVLLTAGEAVVADFGIARAVRAAGGATLTESGVAVGTVAYMSPEQAAGSQDVDARSDVYGLGCLLYEMLAGEPPFTGPSAQVVTARKLSGTAPDVTVVRDTVPAEVEDALRQALAIVPADRHPSAMAFAEALGRASGPMPSAPRDRSSLVSRRALLAGAATTGALGFAAGAILTARPRSRATPRYHRLTFQRGMIRTARFGPDNQTIFYGALWGGDVCRTYRVRPDSPQSHPMDLPPATPLAVSSRGELALALGTHFRGVLTRGTLARVPLAGGVPREMLENVRFADWSPDGSDLAVVRWVEGRQRLEYPAGNVIAEPSEELGGGFSFPRVSPDGDRVAFFALTGDALTGRVATVDREGNASILSPESPNVFGLAWNGDEVWFTAADERPLFRNAIHAVAPDGTARVVVRIPGNASLHDISPDGHVLIAHTYDRGGISLLAPGETQERDYSWLDNSDLADISPDGRTVLFTERGVGGGPESSVYLRSTTGEPAVRLGPGRGLAISPDGRWVLAAEVSTGVPNDHLTLLPVGPGQARRLERPGFVYDETVGGWMPEGERVLVRAAAADRGYRFYVQEVEGEGMVPVTPEGRPARDPRPPRRLRGIRVQDWELAPDGAWLAVSTDGGVALHPLAGGDPRPLPGSGAWGALLAWTQEGLLLLENPEVADSQHAMRIIRVDPFTGDQELWREIRPRDPAGIMSMPTHFEATPDGRAYGYSWHRALSDLYLVEGLS